MSSRIRSFSKLVLELDSALKAFQSSDAKFRVLKTVYPPSRSRPPRSGKSGVHGYGDVTTTTTTTIPSALSSRGEGGERAEEGEEPEEEEEYYEDLSSPLPPPKTLFILDSSFNPPSIAHAALAQSAFLDDCNSSFSSSSSQPSQPSQQQQQKKEYEFPHRLLLLFAVTNADKIAAPASFEHRLAMMTVFARDLQDFFASLREKQKGKEQQKDEQKQHKDENEEQKEKQQHPMAIDIGVTKYPFYTDKSRAIESEGYPTHPRHIHLLGYDTLTRIFTAKYYIQQNFNPPFAALQPYFDKGYELRVTLRPDPSSSPSSSSVEKEKEKEKEKEDQKTSFLSNLTDPQGEMQKNGAQALWARQIEFVSPQSAEMGVSSTRIREAVGKGEWEVVRELCTPRVAGWVEREGLYLG